MPPPSDAVVASRPARRRSPVRLLWPLALLFLFAWPFPHWDALRSPNELSRLYQVRAIVDDGRLDVNRQLQRYGPMGDLSAKDGRFYPNKAPGISFLGAPVYWVVKLLAGGAERVPNRALLYFLRLFCCIVPTLLLLRPLRRYAARMAGETGAADAALVAYALGSLGFTYSLLFFSHQISAVLAMAAFLLLERAKDDDRAWRQIAAGALAGYSVVCEYTLAPVAALLAIYGVATARTRLQALLRIGVGALPCVGILMAYHQAAWGNPFSVGYAHVTNEVFAGWHAQGLMGVAAPKLSSLLGNLFSTSRGLFAYSPAFLLALPGIWWLRRESKEDALLAGTVTVFYFFLAAAFLYEAWGWMLGPRHLTPLVPFLVAPLACAIATFRRLGRTAEWRFLPGVAGGLVAASVLVTGVCSAVYPHIPEEFSAGLAHLVWPFLASGHLPYNLGEVLLGQVALWTWVPWFLLLAFAAFWSARRCVDGPQRPLGLAIAAGTLAVFVALLFVTPPRETPREKQTRRELLEIWEPTPRNVRKGLF